MNSAYDRGSNSMQRVTVRLEGDQLREIDAAVEDDEYVSRSQAFRELLSAGLDQQEDEN